MGRIIFVNGKIGGGSPPAGEPYWRVPDTPFVEQAVALFDDHDSVFYTKVDHAVFSSVKERWQKGKAYADVQLHQLVQGMKPSDTIKIVAHSMGCAFAEGMAQLLLDKGYHVSCLIHINAFQSGHMTANPQIPITIDYQYTDDVVIRVPFLSKLGAIKGAMPIRKKSNIRIRRRHRGPIYPASTLFWEEIRKVLLC